MDPQTSYTFLTMRSLVYFGAATEAEEEFHDGKLAHVTFMGQEWNSSVKARKKVRTSLLHTLDACYPVGIRK